MPRRIALLLSVSPLPHAAGSVLHGSDVQAERELRVGPGTFILTLERESGAGIARGHLESLASHLRHSVQSDAGLFEALADLTENQDING